MNKYGQIFKQTGAFESSGYWSDQDRQDTEIFFHHSQKAEIMMTVSSSWFSGDFFEFGSADLNMFRDMLTAYNVCGMTRAYPDVQFWAFDIFGKLEKDVGNLKVYFEPYSKQGDKLQHHYNLIKQHGLYVDKCHLVQGLFADTLTPELKKKWQNDKVVGIDYSEIALHLAPEHRNSMKRQIGFASIDCNMASSYKTVFEWIADIMAENSYIYMDEYPQNPDVIAQFEQFVVYLHTVRNMSAVYVRNAAGFGSLFRLFPITNSHPLALP